MSPTAHIRTTLPKWVDSLRDNPSHFPLEEHVVPYADLHLKTIALMANLHSPFFQNIVFFTHNYFEIRIWTELFAPTDPSDLVTLEIPSIEPLFLQSIAIYRVSVPLGLDFINFSLFSRLPGNIMQFAVAWPSLSAPALSPALSRESRLKEVLRLFQGNPAFHGLNEGNYLDFFYRLSGKYTFNERNAFLYRFEDFSSGVLHAYPQARMKSGANIRIHIKTPGPVQKQMAKKNSITHLVQDPDTVFLADIVLDDVATTATQPLFQVFARLVPGLSPSPPEDFVAIIERMTQYLQQSSFTTMLLLVDHLNTKEDAEFLNYLLEASGYPTILLICFDAGDGLMTFDLELNENPVNFVAEYLEYGKTEMDENELRIMKTIAGIPVAVSWDRLFSFFPDADVALIRDLVRRKWLKVSAGKVIPGAQRPAWSSEITTMEANPILDAVLKTETAAYPGVRIVYLIRDGLWEELKTTLHFYLNSPTGFDVDIPDMETLLAKNTGVFSGNIELGSLLMAVLVEGNHYAAAHCLKESMDLQQMVQEKNRSFSFFLLTAARLCHVEKNHRCMAELLDAAAAPWDGNIPKSLNDLFHYLKYLSLERQMDKGGANRHFKAIKGSLYQKRATVLWSDRFIYQGDYGQAESLLMDALDFFSNHHFTWDEIETRSQLAKLARERGDWTGAEKMYKNIFIKSEMKTYPLLSAHICIDLGNLYLLKDYFNRAETWYRKALRLFQTLGNKNGINTAESNLVDIDKINGNWAETKRFLEAILKHDKEHGTAAALAVDYFNIGHLEYLKHNTVQAKEWVENASLLFKQKENVSCLLECEFLKLHLELLRPENHLDLNQIKKLGSGSPLSRDQKVILSVLETVAHDPRRLKGLVIAEKVVLCQSDTLQYQLIVALLGRYPLLPLLEKLKTLSMGLSKEAKNYYFYEYYYMYYSYFFQFDTTHPDLFGLPPQYSLHSDEERNRFMEVYYFFLRNGRMPTAGMAKNKQWLDEREAVSHLFKRAEWVEDSRGWQIPEDFFSSLILELRKRVPVDLVRLTIYERPGGFSPTPSPGQEKNQSLFDFSRVFAGSLTFRELTTEITRDAFLQPDHFTLTAPAIKQTYHSPEKAFYAFNLTRVFRWKLSASLFGVLIIASDQPGSCDPDFFPLHQEFFAEFGTLIHRYYQTVYQLNLRLGFIIGESPAVKRLKEQILKVSKVDYALLVRGESGCGKELVAKAVHLLSQRSGLPFVPVNAAAIPENLLEAELFGYKKGAFTGANESKTGLIEAASGGTLFLDEIGDLPLNLQAKILCVLQESEIRRLGENKTITVDVRLICATNKDLKNMIVTQQFREDLFFRIQDLTIQVPPLRDRVEDIPLLVAHFLQKYGFAISDKIELNRIFRYFTDRTWPGNIRELESSVKRLITFYPDFEMDPPSLTPPPQEMSLDAARDQLEEMMVKKALEENHGSKIDAAAALKISRQYLFRLIKKYKIKTK